MRFQTKSPNQWEIFCEKILLISISLTIKWNIRELTYWAHFSYQTNFNILISPVNSCQIDNMRPILIGLFIIENSLRHDIRPFCTNLLDCRTLKSLDISCNGIGSGINALTTVLNSLTLETLILSHNRISPKDKVQLFHTLETNSTLQTLAITEQKDPAKRSHSFFDSHFYKIAESLSKNKSLTSLAINGLGRLELPHLEKALQYNQTLLYIRSQKIPDTIKRELEFNRTHNPECLILLLLARKHCSRCLLHKDRFPLDLFKIVVRFLGFVLKVGHYVAEKRK